MLISEKKLLSSSKIYVYEYTHTHTSIHFFPENIEIRRIEMNVFEFNAELNGFAI